MRTVRKRSQIQEKSVASDFCAKTVIASGAMWNAKGDVRSEKFLIECKTTAKEYYSVTTKVWEKIEREANRDGGRIPLLIVDLKDRDRYVVFDPKCFDKQILHLDEGNIAPHGGVKSARIRRESILPHLVIGLSTERSFKKAHVLVVLPIDTFIEVYEEELED